MEKTSGRITYSHPRIIIGYGIEQNKKRKNRIRRKKRRRKRTVEKELAASLQVEPRAT